MDNKIQVTIIERYGRKKGLYRWQTANGQWNKTWFHMSVRMARLALRNGTTELVKGRTVTVEEYRPA